MLNIIGSVFKYSVLVIVVLVLSHIVQVRGVSISRHVENTLDWIGEFNPKKVTRTIGSGISSGASAIGSHFKSSDTRVEKIDSTRSSAEPGADISVTDEKQLRQIIHQKR